MITLSVQAALDSLGSVTEKFLAGGTLEVYSGTMPQFPEDAITTQVLLLTITLPGPVYQPPEMLTDLSAAIAYGNPIAPANPTTAGVASWARVRDSTGGAIFDGDVGIIGSDAMFRVSSNNLSPSVPVAIVLAQFLQPRT